MKKSLQVEMGLLDLKFNITIHDLRKSKQEIEFGKNLEKGTDSAAMEE